MFPSDVLGTYVDSLPVFAKYQGTDPTVRDIIVSFSTNILVCLLTCLVCFRFLGLLDFTTNQRIAGVLALLFGTTFLHYTQNMMENNYIALLTFSGLTFQYEWLRTGKRWALTLGSAALGANLLTRLTTGMDLLAVGFFLLLIAWFTNIRGSRIAEPRSGSYARDRPAALHAFFAINGPRYIQFVRFGSFFNTCIQIFGEESKRLDPTLPAAFPFETPFRVGFFGALFTPEKSVFLILGSAASAYRLASRQLCRLEAVSSRDQSVSDRVFRPAVGLRLLLCAIHGMERRHRLGRPLRFYRGAIHGLHRRSIAVTPPRGD